MMDLDKLPGAAGYELTRRGILRGMGAFAGVIGLLPVLAKQPILGVSPPKKEGELAIIEGPTRIITAADMKSLLVQNPGMVSVVLANADGTWRMQGFVSSYSLRMENAESDFWGVPFSYNHATSTIIDLTIVSSGDITFDC